MDLRREIKRYYPALALDALLPQAYRRGLILVLSFATALLTVFIVFQIFSRSQFIGVISFPIEGGTILIGFWLITSAILLNLLMFSFYYNSLYFRGVEYLIHEEGDSGPGATFEVAHALKNLREDLVTSFLSSPYGIEILARSNIPEATAAKFLEERKIVIPISELPLPERGYLTLGDVGNFLFERDDLFQEFLLHQGVTKEVFMGATEWVMRIHQEQKHDRRWWSREQMGKITGIGQEWSYGGSWMLDQFSRSLKTSGIFSVLSRDLAYADDKITQMETILAKSTDANVLIVGEHGVGKMDIVVRLSQKISKHNVIAPLSEKRIVVLDVEAFMAAHATKKEFDAGFLKMLSQTEKAGDVIVAIENVASFLDNADRIGSDVPSLMDQYLASPNIQFIVTSDPVTYHEHIETRQQFLGRFDRIQIENPGLENTKRVLERIAVQYEKYGYTFTFLSIQAIADAADRYITDGVMPDKAVNLLVEVSSAAQQQKVALISKEFVDNYVSDKTGIPAGAVTEKERDKLLNLEEHLHKLVIGQSNAVKAISSAMRRARVGIQSGKRPMGSFLFVGSTGVGKTETAKALATIFFNDANRMLRLDMSEYSGPDALTRMIGKEGHSGTLANLLKDKPYGVLLLDEFEKATGDVHNLFLQILDEGFFTDAQGGRISARNVIVIATSNAGSEMIWDLNQTNKNPADYRDEIIDNIVKDKIFRPELVNRFDGVVIFEPLNIEDLERIAEILLSDLHERVKKKGYDLVIDSVLINLLTTKGYNPQFGARPMRRVMQDIVEEKIAQKIIAGGLKPGDEIWFFDEDFTEEDEPIKTNLPEENNSLMKKTTDV